jgi:hypothetical protein
MVVMKRSDELPDDVLLRRPLLVDDRGEAHDQQWDAQGDAEGHQPRLAAPQRLGSGLSGPLGFKTTPPDDLRIDIRDVAQLRLPLTR